MTSKFTLDLDLAQEVLSTVDCGLSRGLGEPQPGQMCVEAAVSYALGLGHSDDPGCVAPSLREFVVALNDAPWSSRESRAAGLRKLAIAQLGSLGELNDVEFVGRLAERVIKEILPETLRRLNVLIPLSLVPRVEAAAERCEREGSSSAALSAAGLLTVLPATSEEWTEPDWSLWDASEPARLAATKTAKLAARASLQAAEARASLQAAEARASLQAAKAFELSLQAEEAFESSAAAEEATAWRHRDALCIAESAAIDSSLTSAAAIREAADSASEAASAHGLPVYEAARESDDILRRGAELCVEILRGFVLPGVALMDQLVSS